jgi:hypothetical protein
MRRGRYAGGDVQRGELPGYTVEVRSGSSAGIELSVMRPPPNCHRLALPYEALVTIVVVLLVGCLMVVLAITEVKRRLNLRRHMRDEIAHLREVAQATGGELDESSEYGPRVQIDLVGWRCMYGILRCE